MVPTLTFVIPVRHPDNAVNWGKVKSNLESTARSVALQDDPSWRGIIVANHAADLPPLPAGFSVARVDFAPNATYARGTATEEEFYDAVRLDKGRRILAGLREARDSNYIMVVDDDDFVSRKIVSYVRANQGANGWFVDEGYVWPDGGSWLYKHRKFSDLCGTSHIIRTDLFGIPRHGEETDAYIRRWLGSHRFIESFLAEGGSPISALPFPGAVYRVNYPGNHSQTQGLISTFFEREEFSHSPFKTIAKIRNFRPKAWVSAEFFP